MSSTTVVAKEPKTTIDRRTIVCVAIMIVAALYVYARSLGSLAHEWWTNPDYSHGLLLPFALAYLAYEKRHSWASIPVRANAWGTLLIVGGIFLKVIGYTGAEVYLQNISLLFVTAGVVVFLLGYEHLKELSFILLMVALTIPLPNLIFNQVALPLQLLASTVSEFVLSNIGIPIFREGNILQLPNLTLSVAEACSGIRSLMSLITLGVMMAYFVAGKWWIRAVLIASTVPLAIAANVVRVSVTGVLARHYGEKAATGFFHSFSGWAIFIFAFIVLFAEIKLIRRYLGEQAR